MELMKQLCYIVMFIGKKKWCQHVWLDGNFVFLLIWYMREYYGSKVYSKFDEWWWLVISETTMTTTTKQNKNPTHIHTNTKLCFEYIYHESINLVHNIQHINFSLVNNGEYPSKLFFFGVFVWVFSIIILWWLWLDYKLKKKLLQSLLLTKILLIRFFL